MGGLILRFFFISPFPFFWRRWGICRLPKSVCCIPFVSPSLKGLQSLPVRTPVLSMENSGPFREGLTLLLMENLCSCRFETDGRKK